MSDTRYVGIDVAKGSFDVALDPPGLALSLPNDPTGRQRLLDALQNPPVALIVLEATGGYERTLVADLIVPATRSSSPILAKSATSPAASDNGPRPIESTPKSWPDSPAWSSPSHVRKLRNRP